MIIITSPLKNFRRAGVAHPQGRTEYKDTHFTPEQLAILKKEPNLTVQVVADPAPARPNVQASIEQVKAAPTPAALDQLAKGEDRATVLAAIDKRRAELTNSANS